MITYYYYYYYNDNLYSVVCTIRVLQVQGRTGILYLVVLSDRIRLCTTTAQDVSANVLGGRPVSILASRVPGGNSKYPGGESQA